MGHTFNGLFPTNEKDGEGDEEQEDMGNQVEGVHEASIVQHTILHTVGIEILVVATKRQGHATSSTQAWSQSVNVRNA